MSIKPILFNGDMVRAILDGRKTVTRRVVKPQPEPFGKAHLYNGAICSINGLNKQAPYHTGDILYVRETWHEYTKRVGKGEDCYLAYFYGYKASIKNSEDSSTPWRPSIHMPKESARIWLKVTNVRVERLQDITMEQCVKEGLVDSRGFIHSPGNEYGDLRSPKLKFQSLWDSTVKKPDIDRYGWEANPWVWVIEFERCEKPQEENNNG